VRRHLPHLAIGSLAIAWALVPADAHAQFRYPFPYPYGAYRYAPESDLRIDVTPKEAGVYVDGYFAGTVDEFNGTFQRLHVMPGEHEIVIYLDGYRSIRERLYLSPRATRKIAGTLERLAPGEPSEAFPQPTEPPAQTTGSPVGRPMPRPGQPPPPPGPEPGASARPRDAQGATLMIQVQPADADVLIDGERWRGPGNDDRLVVQVTDGRHRIEVRKEGYEPFTTEVDVGGGESVPLNVSLPRTR
jgi:hypothetical protein